MSSPGQHVLSSLRQMIVSGELKAGERIAEIPTAEHLGVSRTPVRIAFRTLEQEGLLEKLPRRGYQVRQVSASEINGAVEVRGVLEGLAARQATEKGLSERQRSELQQCITRGEELFAKGHITMADLEVYHDINRRFHALIIDASNNPAIAAALSRNEHLPFASINALAVDSQHLEREYRRFYYAHMQHMSVLDAIERGQAARAEDIMREHANATLRYAELFNAGEEGEVEIIGH